MKIVNENGKAYKLPERLNDFQQKMYIHLINWKWKYITEEAGFDDGIEYDAILPASLKDACRMLYPDILVKLRNHLQKYPFRIHKYFNHMASSQAANINLFLPVLLHPQAAAVMKEIKKDLVSIATDQLDKGYRIEFWDEPYGNLNDKTRVSGTDSDIAIAYHNEEHELCLWLIEHKLTEKEFTDCGGYKSTGNKTKHNCHNSFAEIIKDKNLCYYHNENKFNYWRITENNQSFFINHNRFPSCPFRRGLNQLWRNQLLGLSIEQDNRQPYKHVYFSIVKHPRNTALDNSITHYKDLIANNEKFSVFTSLDVINAAAKLEDPSLDRWAVWYRKLYNL